MTALFIGLSSLEANSEMEICVQQILLDSGLIGDVTWGMNLLELGKGDIYFQEVTIKILADGKWKSAAVLLYILKN